MFNKMLARVLRFAASRCSALAASLAPIPIVVPEVIETPHDLWLKADGDKTLRLAYPLSPNSIVLDVGGFEGQWASDIFSRYLCTVHIFEPVPVYAAAITDRFAQNVRIHLHPVGLADRDGEVEFSIAGDASSVVVVGLESVTARVVAFDEWCTKNRVGEIALMKINIEGGEYLLLEHLIESGLICRIQNLQVQFHDFFPDAERRMSTIQQRLAATHEPTYQYKFVWENWMRKDRNA
jgi:FkbM family methyltransferase